jgi:hypothetical protein
VKWIDQVLAIALEHMPTALPEDELVVDAVVAAAGAKIKTKQTPRAVKH